MRIGIFSDVHGNLEALEKVLGAFSELGVDRCVCLGDVVGYGAQPNECCELVRERASVVVLGNHDAAVAGRMDYSYYYSAARKALDWSRRHLTPENLRWLEELPVRADDPLVEGAGYTHGSPLEPEAYGYIFALEQARELVPKRDELRWVNFIGHSHLCKSFALGEDTAVELPETRFELKGSSRYVVTVGSVGQPRDLDNRACAGIFDSESRRFEYVRVEYDIDAAAEKIMATTLAPDFAKRLFLGV